MSPLSLLMGETCHLVGWQVPPFVKPVTLGDNDAAEKGLLLQGDFSPPVLQCARSQLRTLGAGQCPEDQCLP